MAFLRDSSREFISRWQDAWQNDRLDELRELYSHNAILTTPDGQARRGGSEINPYVSRFLPLVGGMTISTVLLTGSGDLGVVFGRYQLSGSGQPGGVRGDQGDHLTILFRHQREWTIRNQTFISGGESADSPWPPGEELEPLPPLDLSALEGEMVEDDDWLRTLYPAAASLAVRFNDVWSSGDLAELLSLSTSDVFMRTADGEFHTGGAGVGTGVATAGSGFGQTLYLGPVDFTASSILSVLHARYFLQDPETLEAAGAGMVFLVLRGSGSDLTIRGVVFVPGPTP
jgi:ketosteroid isomerase-like protein